MNVKFISTDDPRGFRGYPGWTNGEIKEVSDAEGKYLTSKWPLSFMSVDGKGAGYTENLEHYTKEGLAALVSHEKLDIDGDPRVMSKADLIESIKVAREQKTAMNIEPETVDMINLEDLDADGLIDFIKDNNLTDAVKAMAKEMELDPDEAPDKETLLTVIKKIDNKKVLNRAIQ